MTDNSRFETLNNRSEGKSRMNMNLLKASLVRLRKMKAWLGSNGFRAARVYLAIAVGLCGAATAQAQPQPALLTILHSFYNGGDGELPLDPLELGADNILYGTTSLGGSDLFGIVFKINRDGSGYTILHNFSAAEAQNNFNTIYPCESVIQGRDRTLYGTAFGGTNYPNGMVFKLNTDGSGFTILHSFTNTDAVPSSLMQGNDGTLYGAGLLAVFKLDTDGSNYTALHIFNSASDGYITYGKLIQGSDGALYGTANRGGTNGWGTVFKLNTDGSGFKVLHTFTNSPDGRSPRGGLIQGSDGALYGTTVRGGTNGAGTIFRLNTNGTDYEVLYSFQTNGVDGQAPGGALVEGLDHMLYGTTESGGMNGSGTIFEIGQDGSGYAVLFSLVGSSYAGLVQGPASDGSGVLYGMTELGGGGGEGTVFAVVVNPPLSITPIVSQTGGNPVVVWPAWALNYELQTTTNLSSGQWITATNGVPAAAFIITNSPPNSYYRLIWKQ